MNGGLNAFELQGRTALVTGAAGLLGTEHCAALMACGAHVVLTDLHRAGLDRAADTLASAGLRGTLSTLTMDVTSVDSISAVVAALQTEGRRVDVLVNNAAIDPKVKADQVMEMSRLENMALHEWNLQLAVGLTGAFLCTQAFGSRMASDGRGGVILNIASDLSVFSPDQRLYRRPGLPPDQQPVKPLTYSVIKSGLVGMTRYVATYWAEQGVRANSLSPGGVFNGQGDEFVQRLSTLIPLGRMARRDEYRSAVQFLCSDASSYMNGQNVVMDGGRSAW